MEKISNFFKELKERVSNPLFFSFIISWIFFNWKVVIILLFYKIENLHLDNYNSYIDAVSKNIDKPNSFAYPFYASLLYTFAFPFFRNLILGFSSWIKAWGNTFNLWVAKGSKVSISKYIELRETYEKRTKLLEDVLEKESNFLKENETLKNNVLSLSNEKNALNSELQNWRSVNNFSVINGTWELKYVSPLDINVPLKRISIESGNIREYDGTVEEFIQSFYYYPPSAQMSFTVRKSVMASDGIKYEYHYYALNVMDDLKLLRGKIDERFLIELKKVY